MNFKINHRFTSSLPGDPEMTNERRQVHACYSFVYPVKPGNPKLISVSADLAKQLELDEKELLSQKFLDIFSGTSTYPNSKPYAMCYGGYQFGHWAGQLGDGRAINLFDIDIGEKKYCLQLKGAGETPYSRTADGLAVLRSSIREYLCSEAMYYLGVPTTRALCLIATGDDVWRDMMYDGNAAFEKGAIVCRVAPSFIRFGNFEILASRGDVGTLKQLADFTIDTYFPQIQQKGQEAYITFFNEVAMTTLDMIIHWQRVGFVHGVMNTDNMSILGLTIDYGPYGWLEGYDENWTPNTTDSNGKRYAFGNQPNIALWNVLKLANALYPLIEEVAQLQEILNEFKNQYSDRYLNMMSDKLGMDAFQIEVRDVIRELILNFRITETDFTIFFRNLAKLKKQDDAATALAKIRNSFYTDDLNDESINKWINWLSSYLNLIKKQKASDEERSAKMNSVNPKYVLRNFMAQLAIDKANAGDYSLVGTFMELIKKPYDEQPEFEEWFTKRPEWARVKIGCSMLSCSS